MARAVRFFGKKRGHRRTGAPVLGSAGEAIFSAVLLLLGCAGLVWAMYSLLLPEWRANYEFAQGSCKVLRGDIEEKRSEDGILYRPAFEVEYAAGPDAPVTQARSYYDVQGGYFSNRGSAQAILGRFKPYKSAGDPLYPCWYDPSNPSVVVLVRGYPRWTWLLFTVPISFIIIGAGGVAHALLRWGKSAERRAAGGRRHAEGAPSRAAASPSFPFVPHGANITISPGTKLKFRLPMAHSPGWALFGMLVFCLLWNGIWITMLAVRKYRAPSPDWLLILFIIPFLLIGLAAVAVFIRRLWAATAIGPTCVEISDHPLEPGRRYQAFLSHAGRRPMKDLRVSLACEEVATFSQGTNTRKETREVLRRELFRREPLEVRPGIPFETDIELDLPAGAMHSFAAEHNEIRWVLLVEGCLEGRPDYQRAFSIVVRPAAGGPQP